MKELFRFYIGEDCLVIYESKKDLIVKRNGEELNKKNPPTTKEILSYKKRVTQFFNEKYGKSKAKGSNAK